jgi:hypothetical protein
MVRDAEIVAVGENGVAGAMPRIGAVDDRAGQVDARHQRVSASDLAVGTRRQRVFEVHRRVLDLNGHLARQEVVGGPPMEPELNIVVALFDGEGPEPGHGVQNISYVSRPEWLLYR